ncbi:hypothetical protein NDU88_002340 [Pleurodeles waltl]|uniref:Uncharacterized protein n=1 Tax=Pleurodeles waltl TaxID=8319 RepID=A0AAV7VA98_PLEWA|nr:hypothetical protein NDU88_002340 [Pleurodeles waltl]
MCAKAPISDSMQLQAEEHKQATQATQGTHDLADKPPTLCSRKVEGSNLSGGDNDGKNLEVEASKIGRVKKIPDWSRDDGDKFYSLTEDSEVISSGCNQSAVEGSTSSESESVSSAAGPTVRPQRRHHRCIKSWSGSTGGAEPGHSNGTI